MGSKPSAVQPSASPLELLKQVSLEEIDTDIAALRAEESVVKAKLRSLMTIRRSVALREGKTLPRKTRKPKEPATPASPQSDVPADSSRNYVVAALRKLGSTMVGEIVRHTGLSGDKVVSVLTGNPTSFINEGAGRWKLRS